MRIIEGRNDLWERKKIITANGVAEVVANEPFLVQVANFSDQPVYIQKNMKIGTAVPVPIPGTAAEVEKKTRTSSR